ncbi:MAG: hypothetical protein M1820_001887 [Bogoriella megaspora]|nr:MAG: hypothetical protein M1820_001887 [Bogoriella megaspora]
MSLQASLVRCFVLTLSGIFLRARFFDESFSPIWLSINFIILFFSAIVFWILYNAFIYAYYTSPLRHLPAAKQRSVLQRLFKEPNAFHFETWINEQPDAECIRYFGFLNSERLLITSPAGVNQVLRLQGDKMRKQYAVKTQLQRVSGENGLVVTDGDLHKKQRRIMDPTFRIGQIKSHFYPLFWRRSAEMLEVIRSNEDKQNSGSQQPQSDQQAMIRNMDDIFGRTIFDIIGEASMTHDWKALSSPGVYWTRLDKYREAITPSKNTRDRILLSFILPTCVLNALPFRFNTETGPGLQRVRDICKKSVATKCERLARTDIEKSGMDMLDSIMRANRFHTMSFEELQDQAFMMQSGGSHTSVIALLSTVYLLAQHRNSQTQLREEIREMLPPCDQGSAINPDIFARMPYLDAVINEVLRLYSAFSWTGRVPTTDVVLFDTTIPKGTALSISPWALHRSFKLWGADAKEFKPERWLNGSPTVPREPCSFISFGAGATKCIAEDFAKAELRCVIAALFGRYEIAFPEGQALPGFTHQVAFAFRKPILVRLDSIDGW